MLFSLTKQSVLRMKRHLATSSRIESEVLYSEEKSAKQKCLARFYFFTVGAIILSASLR